MKIVTLCFLERKDAILLALKKRGFGAGKWNGAGGKYVPGVDANIRHAVVRETHEELGVALQPDTLDLRAVLFFHYPASPEKAPLDLQCFTYFTSAWEGKPQESEEMRPQWFLKKNIPYTKMWEDDAFWLPKVLAHKNTEAHFWFDADNHVIRHTIEPLDQTQYNEDAH
jgi:8-oxo-dGTP pyrophosphatase MutT (NUDIX family)